MTIIIAQKTTTGVLLAADNNSHDGVRRSLRATPKLVQVSPRVAYGTSGHTRVANILRGQLDRFPKPTWTATTPERESIDEYEIRIGRFFRELIKEGGYPESKMWALVAVDDHIFDVGPDGGVIRVADPFTAGGEAELVALGALHAHATSESLTMTRIVSFDPEYARIAANRALNACAAFIDSISPPWSFVETTKPIESNAT